MEYGLIGEKLGHSYSKMIHEMIGEYEYELKEIKRENLEDFILSKDYKGLNVTIPYKQDVMKYLDFIDDGAQRIGAVNTVVNENGVLKGYNTDFYGLKELIEYSGIEIPGKKVLILGSGGTSRTARAVVDSLKAASVYRVSRESKDGLITYEEAVRDHKNTDVIINTTPCGMYPKVGTAPIDLSKFDDLKGVVDVVYNPARTQLMLDAQRLGIKSAGGLRMLVFQAIAAARFFTGTDAGKEKADEIYRSIAHMSDNIVLIGMPSVGKSTVGKHLANELSMDFFDTDELIVERENRRISDIFAQDGEAYFRRVESEVIAEVSLKNNVIIATGGGAILNPQNVDMLKAYGTVYLLQRDIDSLKPTASRPLSSDKDKLKRLYEERMPVYLKAADVTVDGNKGIEAETEMIKRYRDEH